MPTQVIMPQMGESVDEGTITRWLKAEGEQVEEYEPLLEVNTDKVDTEIPSPVEGVLLEILIPEGSTVRAGTVLGWIGEKGEQPPAGASEAEAVAAQKTAGETAAARVPSEQAAAPATPAQRMEAREEAQVLEAPTAGRDRDLGFISPVVARIASQENVDLYQVQGTGKGGRITKKDVLTYLEERGKKQVVPEETRKLAPEPERKPAPQPAAPAPSPSIPAPMPGEIVPLTPVRRSIAEHMVASKRTSPHVTTVMEVDLSRVIAHRNANRASFEADGVNLTFTAYFIAATVEALRTYPIVNSSWTDEGILIHREMNIGMATSLGEAGLIVPVVKNAGNLSLLGIARTVNDLAQRARSRQLKPDEVKEGTFTITNHGVSGSLFASPIINQPQCAILGVGVIQKRVVVIDDAIAIRPMAYLSLTFDHRILDGATADYFLGKVVKSLENWQI